MIVVNVRDAARALTGLLSGPALEELASTLAFRDRAHRGFCPLADEELNCLLGEAQRERSRRIERGDDLTKTPEKSAGPLNPGSGW